jgi:AP-3 complex subunit beta
VVSNAVLVLKSLVQFQFLNCSGAALPSSSTAFLHIIERLAYKIDDIHHPRARACVIWLVGQYAGQSDTSVNPLLNTEGIVDWAPDVLRKVAKSLPQEVR